jgi:hypothetical protein
MKQNVHPLDIVFRLAEDHGIVLLNGSGFEAPNWSVRVSFANLNDHVYDDIGRAVRAVARSYRQAYEAATGKKGVAQHPTKAEVAGAVPQLAKKSGARPSAKAQPVKPATSKARASTPVRGRRKPARA